MGAVAARLGLDRDAVHHYERRGILPEPSRYATGRHRYSGDVHLIEVLLRLRETGMLLANISSFTRLVASDPDGVPELLALLREHRERIVAKRRQLKNALALIDRKVEDYASRAT